MKQTPFVIDVRPVRSETLSAKEYLRLLKDSPGLIDRAQFMPPRVGASDFGNFVVRYARTRHRSMAHG